MDSPISPYEVRCPRCDVSFPIETRQCMHCGGPTGPSGRGTVLESLVQTSIAANDDSSDPTFAMPDLENRELETTDEPSSIGRSLIRSLGGLIWIIVLIGFTLARNCGGNE